ncbi:cytochrome c oxidase subunit 4 [Amnibacterium sp. CER49]|uniref:cytochrome c oxidase subunit 4 n=1 Tax=Amnibacterium sp. CER49 TaxID=3039161 RepID=UPI002448A1D5|nr:cytochrome c oxidase subunit 4 [Amnibacterium sp. CER49]MDH2444685.1 cytochrome c oxidase subunit 4 [Amnibacterium sp. CER49]
MRANVYFFWFISAYAFLADVVYTIWNLFFAGTTNGGGGGRVEPIGTVCLLLTAVMALFIGFYVNRSRLGQGGVLPEDRPDASIDDGDPELGFFSPYSWWPILLAASAALGFLGFVIGIWVAFIGGAIAIVALVGWVYEYYRGFFAR